MIGLHKGGRLIGSIMPVAGGSSRYMNSSAEGRCCGTEADISWSRSREQENEAKRENIAEMT